MNCATHNDTAAVAFCRTCGKPLCGTCTRDVRGVIYCEPCLAARLEGTAPAAFVPPQTAPLRLVGAPGTVAPAARGPGPNPAVAGILAGFFPFGVGAVYCSQYAKGLAHLLIFVMLIFASDHAGHWGWVFGIGIAFFYVYQIIDAVRTAHALQAGQPAPDPLGLGQTFSMGEKFDRGKIPVGAVVLIGLGVLFLLHTMGIMEYGFDRFWPLILIFLGVWMFYRHWERNPASLQLRTLPHALFDGSGDGAHHRHPFPVRRAWTLPRSTAPGPPGSSVVGVVKLVQSSASSAGHIGPLPGVPPPCGLPPPPAPPSSSDPSPSDQGPASSSGEVHNV